MKNIYTLGLLILIIINNAICQSKIDSSNTKIINRIRNLEAINIKLNQQGCFKYFQLNIEAGIGVKGKVLFNNKSIVAFSGDGNLLSANLISSLIENGKNKINLYVESVTDNAKLIEYNDGRLIVIKLYAMNKQDFPDEKNQVFIIKWNKNDSNNIQYDFDIQLKK